MFLKQICQKTLKKYCRRPVLLEELQAARNCSKVLQIPPEAVGED